ncbi:MAG: type VI secretion system contractile sheath large subunit [Desulfobacterium sp.]|nr:type VI secretion system contractile sheath large subunit [Desulfobacterium sp.]
MGKPISFGALDFKVVASMDEVRSKPEAGTPFRICMIGDFSGRTNRASAPVELRPVEVDRDNIEGVMEKLGVGVPVAVPGNAGPPIDVEFSELDDFHPEKLYERLGVFQKLRDTRKRLNDLRTFESARQEVQGWGGIIEPPESPKSVSVPPGDGPESPGTGSPSLLDQIMDEAEDRPMEASNVSAPSEWDVFMKRIVGPHLIPGDDPGQGALVATVDASISGLMDVVLHDPGFQALEAAWRALYFLVHRTETDALLKVYLLDMTKAELAEDLNRWDDLEKTAIYRLFVAQAVGTPGGESWAVLAGNYTFDQTREDAETLGRTARIARLAGAPFIAAAHAHLLGCDSLAGTPDPHDWTPRVDGDDARAWKALRGLPEASYLGLGVPRFLLRLPYGEDSDPVGYFDFEEISGGSGHENYLWGNPSFACAMLLAQAFTRYGWDLRPGVILDIQGLPLHVYKEDGEFVTKPCAEVLVTEGALEKILDLGVMLFLSYKNQDTVRLARFQSLADPLAQLAGPWGDK